MSSIIKFNFIARPQDFEEAARLAESNAILSPVNIDRSLLVRAQKMGLNYIKTHCREKEPEQAWMSPNFKFELS